MRLTTLENVRDLIRFDSIDDIDKALDRSLVAASSFLETKLRHNFARGTVDDYFYVLSSLEVGSTYKNYFRLKKGFVDSGESFTIKEATTKIAADATGATDITSKAIIDYDKGTVFIPDHSLNHRFVKISYTAGLEVSNGDFQAVPTWLSNAAMYQTIIDFNRVNPEFRSDSGDYKLDIEFMQMYVDEAITAHTRYYPYCMDPLI